MKRISIAPMMDYTDRHDRYFLRLISPHAWLYTEMLTTQALLHGNREQLLRFHLAEKPLALQLGGSEAKPLSQCAKMGEDYGYDEINLNVGCPSPRVSSGRFGACLMQEPLLVADCVATMQAAVQVPVSVKCRIGVDEHDAYENLHHFIDTISQTGCRSFIIHARKAWLAGLSPKQNREIPPLRYDLVYQLKRDFPHLHIMINGGIKTLADIDVHLPHVDGVMIGRAAYANPYLLAEIERHYFSHETDTRPKIVEALLPYIQQELQNNTRLGNMTRHILGLFAGCRKAAYWRRYLSQQAHKPGAGIEVVQQALAEVLS